jgi:hypothetical protein
MRFFELRNLQDFVLYLFPALAFVVLFGIGLAFTHFIRKDSGKRHKEIIERFAGGIEGKNAPFPLIVHLIIAGTVIWSFLYILLTGIFEVKL